MAQVGETSPNGVPIPAAPDNLMETEAQSPARRSPQVRAAQTLGSRRPDLLRRQNSTNTGILR